MKRSLLFRNHSFSSVDIPSIPSSFSVEMVTRMQTESTSFRPAAHCPLPVGSLSTLLHSTLPSLVEIHPRHPSLSPHTAFCACHRPSLRACPSCSTISEVVSLGSEDLGRSSWLGARTPKASPSWPGCSPSCVAVWGPGLA